MELEPLLRRGSTTVGALAQALTVSRRTVLRDIATLRERGVPIETEPGRGGGVRLDLDRHQASVRLGVVEIASLWLAATLSQRGTTLPWSAAARSALSKLANGLPRARAARLRSLCRRVVVGPPASAATLRDLGHTSADLLRSFEAAFDGVGLGFDYRDAHGRISHRRVEPHGLLVQPPVWYVLARDLDRGVPRMFRMDRMTRPRLLTSVRFSPDMDAVLDPTLPDDFRRLA